MPQLSITYAVKRLLTLYLLGMGIGICFSLPGIASPTPSTSPVERPILTIEDIICEGNQHTSCQFITKKYYQSIGDTLNPEEIADAKLRLGTLVQFRDIKIYLQKGSKRGSVIVVFDVQEAAHMQYSVKLAYYGSNTQDHLSCAGSQQCAAQRGQQSDYIISDNSITDFNFLGSGKIFTAAFSTLHHDYSVTTDYEYDAPLSPFDRRESESYSSTNKQNDIFLHYSDPHLLGSRLYFLNLKWRYISREVTSTLNVYRENSEDIGPSTEMTSLLDLQSYEFGRRFGSTSYISLSLDYDSFGEGRIAVNYGWNSQNDSLFPTYGSYFRSSVNRQLGSGSEEAINVRYRKHYSLSNNRVISIGGGINFYRSNGISETFSNFDVIYTLINPLDIPNGRYSGWHINLNLSEFGLFSNGSGRDYQTQNATLDGPYDLEGKSWGANITSGYTLQTNKVIFRLNAGYFINGDAF